LRNEELSYGVTQAVGVCLYAASDVRMI